MELLLLIFGVWIAYTVIKAIFGGNGSHGGTQSGPTQRQSPKNTSTYRPKTSTRVRPKIDFGSSTQETGVDINVGSLEGLNDAFTGAPLDRSFGLNQCQSCQVYYHDESLAVLQGENSSQCVSCGGIKIVPLVAGKQSPFKGRNYDPDVITLSDFQSHYNRVVTLEARVVAVRVSRRGSDYALMFERKSWTKGLKLVFFRGSVNKVGGTSFIRSLEGRTVRVRGLLINHRTFGPEIIISERNMILDAK